MVKTSDSVAQACAKLEIQPGCTGSWYDISSEGSTVTLPMEVVTTGSMAVFNSDTHVISSGKKEPVTATFQFVYSEATDEAWDRLQAAWVAEGCEKLMCVRFTPKGGTVGDKEIYIGSNTTTDKAILEGLEPPNASAGEGGPMSAQFNVYGNYSYDTKAS